MEALWEIKFEFAFKNETEHNLPPFRRSITPSLQGRQEERNPEESHNVTVDNGLILLITGRKRR